MAYEMLEPATEPLSKDQIADLENSLSEFSVETLRWAIDKGWVEPDTPRNPLELCMLGVSEFAEFAEAARNGTLDKPCDKWDKGCKLTCGEEELADVIFRTVQQAAEHGIDIGKAVATKYAYNLEREQRHGGKAY